MNKAAEKRARQRFELLKGQLADRGPEEGTLKILRDMLADTEAIQRQRAAILARRNRLRELLPELAASLDELLQLPARRDPGCLAKSETARALVELEAEEGELFRRGLRHRQPEPVWGGTVDTAGALRVACVTGLVQLGEVRVIDDLAELLADPEPEVRYGAARALGLTASAMATPLLRLKLLLPEEHSETTRACLEALLAAGGEELLPFVTQWLDPKDASRCTLAAPALAESGLPGAVEAVVACAGECRDSELFELLCLALAGAGPGPGLDFLLAEVTGDSGSRSEAALDALRPWMHQEQVRQELEQHFEGREDTLAERFREMRA